MFRRAVNRCVCMHFYFPLRGERPWVQVLVLLGPTPFCWLVNLGNVQKHCTDWMAIARPVTEYLYQTVEECVFVDLISHSLFSICAHTSTFTVRALTYTHVLLPIVCHDLTVMEQRLHPSQVPPTVRAPD